MHTDEKWNENIPLTKRQYYYPTQLLGQEKEMENEMLGPSKIQRLPIELFLFYFKIELH